jgi:hypothetical protein
MNKLTVKIILALAICWALQPAVATTFLNTKSPSFEVDTVYNDDVFISGARIKFDSKVIGDLFSLSYEMVQTDTVTGNFMALAYSVQNLAPVLGSYRAAARTMSCNADVGRNVLLLGQEINVGPNSHIGHDADLAGASVIFQGDVAGNLKIKSKFAVISGKVGGNLEFRGDSLTINPNTVIAGDVNYNSPTRATIASGSVISGNVNWKKADTEKQKEKKKSNFWTALTGIISLRGYFIISTFLSVAIIVLTLIPFPSWVLLIVLWFVLAVSGNLLILILKSKALTTIKVLDVRLFPSMGLGFIIFFLTPIVALILFFTVLAAPLSPLLIMLFGAATFAGGIFASLFLGRRICHLFSPVSDNTPGYLCYTMGMTVILFLSFVPILGYILVLLAFMTGLGGLVQTFGKNKIELSSVETVAEAKE